MFNRILIVSAFSLLACLRLYAQDGLREIAPDTNNMKWSGKTKHGLRVGEWKGKDASNMLRVKMNYVNGVLNGEWRTFNYDSRLIEQGNYVNGKKEGKWIGFYDNGDTFYIAPYFGGKISGYYVEYNPTHKLKCAGNVMNGEREGKWENYKYGPGYRELFEYSTVTYLHDTLNGNAQRFIRKVLTEDLSYKNGKLDGHCIWFEYTTGKIWRDEMYTNGKLHGVSIRYWNRTGSVADSGQWEMGHRVGYHIHSFTTNSFSREWFHAPLRDSVLVPNFSNTGEKPVYTLRSIERRDSVKKFRGNGQLEAREVYRDTTAEVWILGGVYDNYVYNSDGRLLTKSTVIGNVTRGYTTYYYPNGKVKAMLHVKSNDAFPANWYYENGALRAHDDSVIAMKLSDHVKLYDRTGKLIPESASDYQLMRDSLYTLSSELVRTGPSVSPNETLIPGVGEKWENQTLSFAEEMPTFPGGESAFQYYLRNSLVHPIGADSVVDGTVYVYFEVAKDGSVGNARVSKGIPGRPAFSDEAIRVISAMPPWSSGKMNGRAVKVGMTVPVKFER